MADLKIGCEGHDFSLLQDTSYTLYFSKIPNVQFFCQVITLPTVSVGVANNATPYFDMKNPGEKPRYDDLQVRILVDKPMNTYVELYNWMHNLTTMNKAVDTHSFASLIVSTREFYFSNIFPVTLSGFTLNSAAPESTSVTFDATFTFDIMELRKA